MSEDKVVYELEEANEHLPATLAQVDVEVGSGFVTCMACDEPVHKTQVYSISMEGKMMHLCVPCRHGI